ncbi:MAG: Rpn family recombination-promoting nuclease/putative transposase [Magnetococcales bacterium]|nr:Rpn family recombination-promoting nuclease/putative transposase [Magnetococcales bacterium]
MVDTRRNLDSVYHRFFAYPETVVDLLEHFLDPALLAELDLSQIKRLEIDAARLKRVNAKLTAESGQRRRGDVVWEIPIRAGGSLFILLIMEFQSKVEGWMVLRLDVYTGLLYQQLVDERKWKPEDGLPPVLPILLYNGEPKWRAATRLRDLIRLPQESPLWAYQPAMQYFLIDEVRFPEAMLKGIPGLTAIFFRIGHPGSPEAMLESSHDLVEWFAKHPDGPPLKRLFRELLVTGLLRLQGPKPLPPIPEELEEVVHMLTTHVEKWSHDIERRGELRGELRGEKKGEATILTRLLQRRFGDLPPWASEKIAQAEPPALEAWSLRVLDAPTLDSVLADLS